MLNKKPANTDNIVSASLFHRPAVPGAAPPALPSVAQFLTLRNIVIALGVAALLIFLGSVVSARIAFLFAALLGLAALVLTDMASRRNWEKDMIRQIRRMNGDYERLVREVARSRNDMAALKKTLSEAGAMAQGFGREGKAGEASEKRMIQTIADQLSRLVENAAATAAEISKETAEDDLLPEMASVDHLTDMQIADVVQAAVKHDRIDLFVQAVVTLPQRKPRFYEMFSHIRVRPGVHLPTEKYLSVALQQDLLPAIDNLMLLRAVQHIRDDETSEKNQAYFCNITSLTLNDPKFMGDLVEFIAQNRALAPRLIFEMSQRDIEGMPPDTLPVLEGLGRLGCRFSMDRVERLPLDAGLAEARYIRFVKVEAALILEEMQQIGGLARMRRLKAELDRHGIDLIVEKIETEKQVRELLDLDIDYGQGHLFGHPVQG